MPEKMTYSSAVQEIKIQRQTIQSYQDTFKNLASSNDAVYDGPKHEESFCTLRSAAENSIVSPLRYKSNQIQNTVNYAIASNGTELKYDTLSGKGDSGFSAYLKNSSQAINGSNIQDSDYAALSNLTYYSKMSDRPEYQASTHRENLSVKEYCNELLRTGGDDMSSVDRTFLEQMASSERFSNVTIDHNIGNTGNDTPGENTAIMVFKCEDGHAIAAIQGTNGTVEDWKTNAQFNGSSPTAEEQYVASVINGYANDYDSFDITGHSQGGREAITSAILMSEENQSKLGRVVSNDGPGYSNGFLANYSSQIEAIEGKVTNIRPSQSYVGELLNPIGNVQYVELITVVDSKNGETSSVNSHLSTTWYIDENGNYVQADGHDVSLSSIAEITPAVSDILSVFLPEDRTEYYLSELVESLGDEDGNISFNKFTDIDTLKKLGSLGKEFISEIETQIDVVAEEQLSEEWYTVMRFCEEADDVLGEIDDILGKVETGVTILALVCPPAAEVCAVVLEVIDTVRDVIKVVRYALKIVEYGLKLWAAYQAYKKKKAREKYIAQNDTMTVSVDILYQVVDVLRQAQKCIEDAYMSYEKMTQNCIGKIRQAIKKAAGASEEEQEKYSQVSQWMAIQHCWKHGVKNFNNSAGKIGNGITAVSDIAIKSRTILSSEGNGGSDTVFTVTPRALSAAATRCAPQADIMKQKLIAITEAIGSLEAYWQGDDYNSIRNASDSSAEHNEKYADMLKQMFDQLGNIANAYSSYQNTVIEQFQNIKFTF